MATSGLTHLTPVTSETEQFVELIADMTHHSHCGCSAGHRSHGDWFASLGVAALDRVAIMIEHLADARLEYPDDGIEQECDTLYATANAIRGDVQSIQTLVPSWRWKEFGAEIS